MRHGLTSTEGFTMRKPTSDDAAEMADLINEVTVAEGGTPWTTTEEMRDELTSPRDGAPPPDVLLVDHEGAIAGALQFEDWGRSEYSLQTFVRPAWWGRGLSALLLRHGEQQVAGLPNGPEPAAVHVFRFTGNKAAAQLFRALEYAYERTFWMMRIELETAEKADEGTPRPSGSGRSSARPMNAPCTTPSPRPSWTTGARGRKRSSDGGTYASMERARGSTRRFGSSRSTATR